MNLKEKGRRSREERRHGGCAEGKGVTLAQQERRSGRKGPQACKASSVRFPARRLAVERRDWLQRQDSNLRHRGYEPRGMTASLRCEKTGAPSFCGLRRIVEKSRPVTNREVCFINLGNVEPGQGYNNGPVAIGNAALYPLVNGILGKRLVSRQASIGDCPRAARLADDLRYSDCRSLVHGNTNNGFKIQFQGKRNPKRKITPAL